MDNLETGLSRLAWRLSKRCGCPHYFLRKVAVERAAGANAHQGMVDLNHLRYAHIESARTTRATGQKSVIWSQLQRHIR